MCQQLALGALCAFMMTCRALASAAPIAAFDWKLAQSADTLDLYSSGNFTGTMVHSLSVNDSTQTVIDKTLLHIVSNGLSAAETSSVDLGEERRFGFDGSLFSAGQEMKSPAGKNTWRLAREKRNGWALSVIAGGTTQVRRIEKLSENLNMTYGLYSGIKRRTVKAGDVFYDTVMDLTSGQSCFSRVTCTEAPSAGNRFLWVFNTFNNLTARDERWELDTSGNTVFQQNFPYEIRRRTGHSGALDRKRAPPLFESLAIPVPRGAADNETITLALDSLLTPDSSVNRFYARSGKIWVLQNVSGSCPGKEAAVSGDSGMMKFTVPTVTMQSNDTRIVRLADSLVKGKTDRCDSIRACFEYVNKTIRKRYSPTFSSALETLSAGFGDCGEHAVLLGALLRAVRVPARVVLGLAYIDGRKGYLYHAWVAAYAGGGAWVFADPALGVFPATRDRVPLVIDDTGSAVMGIAKMLGRIRIDYVKK